MTDIATETLFTFVGEIGKIVADEVTNHGPNSHKTYLNIINDGDKALSIEVSDVDSTDWDGDSRPDKTFDKVEIPPHGNKKERQEINARNRSAWSTIHSVH
jgi:hypothetical protein